MASELRDAFTKAGPNVQERRTGTGRAYLVDGRVVGQVDETPGSLRVRMWLVQDKRSTFEGRPTFDAQSGWLVVVSDEDVGFVRELVSHAYRAAADGHETASPSLNSGQATRAASSPPPSEKPSGPSAASGRPSRSRARRPS